MINDKLKTIITSFFLATVFAQGIEPPVVATTLGGYIDLIFNVLFNLSIVILPVAILAGGVIFLTGATPSRIEFGKKIMLWAGVIFGIMLIAKLIISVTKGDITFLR